MLLDLFAIKENAGRGVFRKTQSSLSPQWPGHGASAAMPPWPPSCASLPGPPSPAARRQGGPPGAVISPLTLPLSAPAALPNPSRAPGPPPAAAAAVMVSIDSGCPSSGRRRHHHRLAVLLLPTGGIESGGPLPRARRRSSPASDRAAVDRLAAVRPPPASPRAPSGSW